MIHKVGQHIFFNSKADRGRMLIGKHNYVKGITDSFPVQIYYITDLLFLINGTYLKLGTYHLRKLEYSTHFYMNKAA